MACATCIVTCGFARFTCPHCRQVFLRHEHDESVCSAELHACPLSALGCSFRARVVDMHEHVKDRVHFDLARRVLKGGVPSYVVVVASDMATALRALLEISTKAWKDTDGDPAPPHDEITERARLEFVHAMLASNIVPPPA
ncbi:hypothetical protein B5M09_000821 [Aphanomyces astaci]|uniref:Uncharacterized protein n=1 Tax=Aphanomyces astaci TaxID=112090 RepID=A0A3R7YQQ8_APHAT|nr:hypothetical protein B5M09_000821 [Aphanomyces astaci]